jgi:2-octaprenyl-6-methoxyphenol hydroxylase
MLYDVCVVGGGLSGLLASCLLAHRGFSVLLVERNDLQNMQNTTHTTAIAHGNIALLRDLGLWQIAGQEAGKIDTIAVSDRNDDHPVFFASTELGIESMGYVLHNRHLMKSMLDQLQALDKVTICDNVSKVDVDRQINNVYNFAITLKDKGSYQSKALFVADGTNSMLAKRFNFSCCSHDYQQTALVFNIRHEHPHLNIAAEKFMSYGPIATLPLQGQHDSAVVWTQSRDVVLELKEHDLGVWRHLLHKHLPDWLGDIEITSTPQYYPLKLLLRYPAVKDNVYLIGSSLRSIHPLAGQAFNVVMRDLALLCSEDIIDQEGRMVNKAKYFMQLCSDGLSMTAVTHSINSIFAADFLGSKLARGLGLSFVRHVDPLRRCIASYAAGCG